MKGNDHLEDLDEDGRILDWHRTFSVFSKSVHITKECKQHRTWSLLNHRLLYDPFSLRCVHNTI